MPFPLALGTVGAVTALDSSLPSVLRVTHGLCELLAHTNTVLDRRNHAQPVRLMYLYVYTSLHLSVRTHLQK